VSRRLRARENGTEWPRALAVRAAALAALWWAFTEGRPDDLAAGIPMVALALAASAAVAPPARVRLRPVATIRLGAIFLWSSLRGGVDVARRALSPRLPISPGYREVPLSLPPGPARLLLVDALSLMPGTLSVEVRRGSLVVHLLDARRPVAREIGELEARVAAALDVPLVTPSGGTYE
jgi:multicomponent Na+:H+ antiporter subunit E